MSKRPESSKTFLAPPYRVSPEEEGTIQSADRAPSRIVEAVKGLKGRKGPGDAR